MSDERSKPEVAVRFEAAIGRDVPAVAQKTGIPEQTLRNYIRGTSEPKVGALVAVAEATGRSIRWLATGEGPVEASPGEQYILWDPGELESLITLAEEILEKWRRREDEEDASVALEVTPERKAWVIVEAYAEQMRYRDKHGRDMPLNAIGRLVLSLASDPDWEKKARAISGADTG